MCWHGDEEDEDSAEVKCCSAVVLPSCRGPICRSADFKLCSIQATGISPLNKATYVTSGRFFFSFFSKPVNKDKVVTTLGGNNGSMGNGF